MGRIGSIHAPGATPPDPDELAGLIPKHIATQEDLNEFEQLNILKAQRWAFSRKRAGLLTEGTIRTLHGKMFDRTWRWAGTFRQTEKSIGVDPVHIAVNLKNLLEDVGAWNEFSTYPIDERAIRLHHRLVTIHPFPNGNGRHARLFTDVYLRHCNMLPFTWGRVNLTNASETRSTYIQALQAADRRDYEPLMAFVRS